MDRSTHHPQQYVRLYPNNLYRVLGCNFLNMEISTTLCISKSPRGILSLQCFLEFIDTSTSDRTNFSKNTSLNFDYFDPWHYFCSWTESKVRLVNAVLGQPMICCCLWILSVSWKCNCITTALELLVNSRSLFQEIRDNSDKATPKYLLLPFSHCLPSLYNRST